MSEKRFAPSSRKLKKARESGDVAKARDLTTAARIAGALLGGSSVLSALDLSVFRDTLFAGATDALLVRNLLERIIPIVECGSFVILATLFSGAAAGIIAECAQSGFYISFDLLAPNFERLSPAKNLKQIFGLPCTEGEESRFLAPFGRAIKPLLLLGLVGLFCWFVLPRLATAAAFVRSVSDVSTVLLRSVFAAAFVLVIASIAIGVLSLVYARRCRGRRLRMNLEELKEELKHNEGNPELRAMRKQLHEQILEMSAVAAVRRAKAVVIGRVKPDAKASQPF